MKSNKIWMALFAVFAISLLSISAIAYRGNPEETGPNYNEEVHDQLEAALDAGDYDLWISIREENDLPMKGRIFSVINEENFDRFVEMHNAMEEGDYETAGAIRAELGLGQGMMRHRQDGQNSMGQGKRGQFKGSNTNFVDSDNDGECDNLGLRQGRGR